MTRSTKQNTTVFFLPNGTRVESSDPRVLIREDGRVEILCKHGIGHCVGHLRHWQKWMGVHGCDGCCNAPGFFEVNA